jgi:hypothetical protein
VAPLDDDGGDLYRLLIVADGAITIAVDLHPRHQSRPHALHRSRRDVPHDPVEAAERACALLRVADEAVARTVDTGRSGTGVAEGHVHEFWERACREEEGSMTVLRYGDGMFLGERERRTCL